MDLILVPQLLRPSFSHLLKLLSADYLLYMYANSEIALDLWSTDQLFKLSQTHLDLVLKLQKMRYILYFNKWVTFHSKGCQQQICLHHENSKVAEISTIVMDIVCQYISMDNILMIFWKSFAKSSYHRCFTSSWRAHNGCYLSSPSKPCLIV